MGTRTIDQLPTAGALAGTEEIPVWQAAGTKKTTAAAIAALAGPVPALPLSIGQGGTGQTTQQAALDALFGSVGKGLLWLGDGTHVTPLAAPALGDVLTGDPAQPHGVHWAPPAPGGVASVTAADATLTIAPNVGAVAAGINLANGNTWTAEQIIDVGGGIRCLLSVPGAGHVFQGGGFSVTLCSVGAFCAVFQDGGGHSAVFSDSVRAADFVGLVRVQGLTGSTFQFTSNNPAAPTQIVGALPVSAYGAGAITAVLGTPDNWARVNVAGTDYLVPVYLP